MSFAEVHVEVVCPDCRTFFREQRQLIETLEQGDHSDDHAAVA